MNCRYKVLYTHQKQKKKKTWQDGYLDVHLATRKACLLTDEFKELDTLFVKNEEVGEDAELESDRYLITVECKHVQETPPGKENRVQPVHVPKANKVLPQFRRPAFKAPVTRSVEPSHYTQKPSQPFHPSLSIPSVKAHANTSCEKPSNSSISSKSYCNKKANEFMNIYAPNPCTKSSINIDDCDRKIKRSTNEILSLFSKDFEDDDESIFSVDIPVEKKKDAPPSLVQADTSIHNFSSDVSVIEHSGPRKRPIESTNFLGLFSQRGNETVTNTSLQGTDDFVNIDEEIDMIDDFADDFDLDICEGMIVKNPDDGLTYRANNDVKINQGCGKDTKSVVHQKEKRVLANDIYDILASKKRHVVYGNAENSTELLRDDASCSSPLSRNAQKTKEALHPCPSPRDTFNTKGVRRTFSAPTSQHRNVEYKFSSKEETFAKPVPKRSVKIPVSFESVTNYKLLLKSAVNEHVNIILFGLAGKYHNALERADVTAIQYGGGAVGSDCSVRNIPKCSHGPCKMNAVRKEGKNKGRLFYACPNIGPNQCKMFVWVDEIKNEGGARSINVNADSKKTALTDHNSASLYFNSHGIQFYLNVKFSRKVPYKNFWKSKKTGLDLATKKSMYIMLPVKKASSFYGKDDLWVVSKTIDFQPGSTFIAKSVFYGPKSNGELEISPLCSYSSPNWQNDEICYAIQAFNAVTEIACIENIDNFVNALDVPVLPSIVSSSSSTSNFNVATTRFDLSSLPPEEVTDLVQNTASSFSLNEDQTCALQKIADMFVNGNNDHVTLIHGVFGAGKSYLLSIVVLFLVQLFEMIETRFQLDVQLKILISSITNVAVDRVLLMLLDHGFEEFIRVGSVKKIAKQVLPYSVHASDKDDQELKELNEILASELNNEERGYVKRAIELHKLGVNRNKLSDVRIVGVTCAACVFPFIQNNIFQVQLQDECSQMMEPVSMLPIARFKCQRLILVGDPKQLSPTIQGSEAEHSFGLEMTLFERLQRLGYETSMLRTQYRCHPAISAICNEMFYDGQLQDGITRDQREPIMEWLPTLSVIDVDDGNEEYGNDGSYLNLKEAEVVVKLLDKILLCGIEPHQVGVITQYKSQVWKINTILRSRLNTLDNASIKSIQISTVDAFQGAEKDIILLSCVRTRHIGFIDCHRRTNVALSRAKKQLVIIGKLKLLNSNACWGGVLDVCRQQKATVSKSNVFLKSLEKISC